jgi:hypothetical protein
MGADGGLRGGIRRRQDDDRAGHQLPVKRAVIVVAARRRKRGLVRVPRPGHDRAAGEAWGPQRLNAVRHGGRGAPGPSHGPVDRHRVHGRVGRPVVVLRKKMSPRVTAAVLGAGDPPSGGGMIPPPLPRLGPVGVLSLLSLQPATRLVASIPLTSRNLKRRMTSSPGSVSAMATHVVTWREGHSRGGAGLHPSDPPIGEPSFGIVSGPTAW